MAKSNTYSNIGEELDWLEEKLKEVKRYIEANPFDEVRDRDRVTKRTYDTKGEMIDEQYMLVATIEVQHKSLLASMKECASLLEVIDKLREKEASKMQVRGGGEVSHLAKKLIQ